VDEWQSPGDAVTLSRIAVLRTSVRRLALPGLIAAATALACVQAQAQAALTLLYFFTGIHDSGDTINVGKATLINCSNFSGANRQIQTVLFDQSGAVKSNNTFTIAHPHTLIVATHAVAVYPTETSLNTGAISHGLAAVLSDNPNIVCTAFIVDAATSPLIGIDLHGVRFNPIAGSQE
jgi:hypothetical protein